MKKSIFKIAILLSLFIIVLSSCKKDDNDDDTNNDPVPNETSFDYIDLTEQLTSTEKAIFINENEGWVLGQESGNNTQSLIYTDDGGSTWATMNSEILVAWGKIKFINSTDGYLVSNGVEYTTDKGITWNAIVFPNLDYPHTFYASASNSTSTVILASKDENSSILFFVSNTTHEVTNSVEITEMNYPGHKMHLSENGDIVIAAVERQGHNYKEIAYSSDNGTSWTYTEIVSEDPINVDDRDCELSFPDDNIGFFTAGGGRANPFLYKTTNGGSSWTKTSISSDVKYTNFDQISFADANNGLGIGRGDVYKTTDGGNTWTELSYFSDNFLGTSTVSYPKANFGFILGRDATMTYHYIYKYTGQ